MYADETPYHYAGNNPVLFNDPLGDKVSGGNMFSRMYDGFHAWQYGRSAEGFASWMDDAGFGGFGGEATGQGYFIGRPVEEIWMVSRYKNEDGSAGDIIDEYFDHYVYEGDQQGVIITVTDKIVGNTVVKGYPNNVLDENGQPIVYDVPLYEVRVSGYDEGNYISETFKAIRFGVYHNKKTGAGPFVTTDYAGVYPGQWEKHSKLGDVIRVLGAGNGHVLFHLGPFNGYVPGANGCVEIFGSGQFNYFQVFVNTLAGGAANNIMIRFEPAAQPPLSPKKTSP